MAAGTSCRGAPACPRAVRPRAAVIVQAITANTASTQQAQQPQQEVRASRRSLLQAAAAVAACGMVLGAAGAPAAHASPVQDLARGFLRPDVAPLDAVVVLMDAKSTLKEIQVRRSRWGPLQHCMAPDNAQHHDRLVHAPRVAWHTGICTCRIQISADP